MKQFGRCFRLEVGNDEEGIAIDNLRIDFSVEKTIDKKTNNATIRIWNLNKDHIHLLVAAEKRYDKVTLAVGYNELRLIYAGEIVEAKLERKDMDLIVQLTCSDGKTDYQQAYAALTLKAGTPDTTVVEHLCQTLAKTVAGDILLSDTTSLPRGRVFFGNTRDLFSRLARNHRADWSIQDGGLMMLPMNRVLDEPVILISEATGMLGMPQKTSKENTAKNGNTREEGVTVSCLLNPALKPGAMIQIASDIAGCAGTYKVVTVKHEGDAMDDKWRSTVQANQGKFETSGDKEKA